LGRDYGGPFAFKGEVDFGEGADATEVGRCVGRVRGEAEREACGYQAVEGRVVRSENCQGL
jgi:hypothetical protein